MTWSEVTQTVPGQMSLEKFSGYKVVVAFVDSCLKEFLVTVTHAILYGNLPITGRLYLLLFLFLVKMA